MQARQPQTQSSLRVVHVNTHSPITELEIKKVASELYDQATGGYYEDGINEAEFDVADKVFVVDGYVTEYGGELATIRINDFKCVFEDGEEVDLMSRAHLLEYSNY